MQASLAEARARGYKVGDKVTFTGVSRGFANGDRLDKGAQGEVIKLCSDDLEVCFPGWQKNHLVYKIWLSHESSESTQPPRDPNLPQPPYTTAGRLLPNGVQLVLYIMQHKKKSIAISWGSTLGGCRGDISYIWVGGGGYRPIQKGSTSENYGERGKTTTESLSIPEFEAELTSGSGRDNLSFAASEMIDSHQRAEEAKGEMTKPDGQRYDAAKVKAAFKAMDLNNDGFVSRDELKAILLRPTDGQPSKLTSQTVGELINMFDADADGKLSVEEISNAFSEISVALPSTTPESAVDAVPFRSCPN